VNTWCNLLSIAQGVSSAITFHIPSPKVNRIILFDMNSKTRMFVLIVKKSIISSLVRSYGVGGEVEIF